MLTTEQRAYMRDRVLDVVRTDPQLTGGALTGPTAVGAEDGWSNIDVAFGIADGISPEAILDDWAEVLDREFGTRQRPEGTSTPAPSAGITSRTLVEQ
jgi:hypothetical protein